MMMKRGDYMQEMLDIYRDDLQKAGILSRNEAHRTGALHAVCHLWVIDSSRSIVYLQQRSSQKDSHPNDYDISCAGHGNFTVWGSLKCQNFQFPLM